MMIQPKLEIGAPNDKYEQEADAMADQVINSGNTVQLMPEEKEHEKVQMMQEEEEGKIQMMSMQSPVLQMMPDPIQMKCKECEEKEKVQKKPEVQKSSNGTMLASDNIAAKLNNSSGKGSSLPLGTQEEMEAKIGADFSNVKIHTDANAVQMNREMGAKAFTHGSDVYFNKGNYQPNSKAGKHLLAHELTHTVHQGGASIKSKKGEKNNGLTIQRKVGKSLIQRAVTETQRDTHAGLFELARHNPVGGPAFSPQAQYDVKLEFTPYQVVDCDEIAMTQTVVAMILNRQMRISTAQTARGLSAAEGTEGKAIDRLSGRTSPMYGENNAGGTASTAHFGSRTGNGRGDKAWITDSPGRDGTTPARTRNPGDQQSLRFETCAICKSGADEGVYYGCVNWGYSIADSTDTFVEDPFELASRGTPSAEFLLAAKKWNDQTVPVATDDLPLPTHTTHQTDMTEAQLNARVTALRSTLAGLAAGHVNRAQITFEIKVYEDILGAMVYNRNRRYHERDVKAIQAMVGATPSGTYDFNTITKIKRWQVQQNLKGDGRFGPNSKAKFDTIVAAAETANKAMGHTSDQVKRIQREVGSNDDGHWGPKTVKRLMAWQGTRPFLNASGEFTTMTRLSMFGFGGF